MSHALIAAMQGMAEDAISNVNTAVPGVVVSYDAGSNRATVRASLPKRLADGQALPAPNIVSVPVVFPAADVGGTQAALTLPLKPGDGVLLHFSQRSLEGWLSGSGDAPDDPRMFDLSDAIAVPGLNAGGVAGDASDVVLRHGNASLRMKPDGTILLANGACAITMTPAGVIAMDAALVQINAPIEAGNAAGGAGLARFFGGVTAAGDVVAENRVSLASHTHRNVQPGGGNSGPPA